MPQPTEKYFSIFLLIALLIVPAVSFADADRIFKENGKAVVVVVAYDENGEAISQGSGFIVRPDGAVVTNYHVVSKATAIKVKAGNKVLEVEGIIHADKENDLVILKAEGKNLPTVKLGDISNAVVGEKVYAISSPEGLENTISDGILSGIRVIAADRKILQITAPISPGSSGGPVFNKKGEVIGVATLLIKEAQNLNFAMPVDVIKDKIAGRDVTALKGSELVDYEIIAEAFLSFGYEDWSNMGYSFAAAGEWDSAAFAFTMAIIINHDFADAHYNLGVAYDNLGKYKEAIDSYQQAVRINPDLTSAHNNLGVAYDKAGKYKEAIESFKRAIKINPNDEVAFINLGLAYGKAGMYKEKIKSYQQVIRINPDHIEIHNDLCYAYAKLGMYKEAIESCKQAIRINPDYVLVHDNLGYAYSQARMLKESVQAYKQVIRIEPDNAKAHHNIGICYLLLNDRGSALEEYKILKTLDPERANELFNMIYE